MTDYRNPDDPMLRRNLDYDPDARSANSAWGWIAGAVFVVVVLAIAFGIGHQPNAGTDRVANNTAPMTAPAAPPAAPANPALSPAPANPSHP
jgi:hypothetical protein